MSRRFKRLEKNNISENLDYNIPDFCKRVKIDIGLSRSANYALNWLQKEKDLFVFGFEPNKAAIKQILQTENRFFVSRGNFKIFPYALSNVPEKTNMKFYRTLWDCGTSSLFEPKKDCKNYNFGGKEVGMGPSDEISVSVIPLKIFFDNFPWDRFEYIEYIKIDTQGSDLNVLKSAGDYLKERVVFVTAEPDGWQYNGAEECTKENIINYMESIDFEFINHPNTSDPTFINKKFLHLKDEIYIKQ